MSLLEVPNAPGAPPGQRGMAVCICEEQMSKDKNKMAEWRNSFILDGERVRHNPPSCQDGPEGKCKMKNDKCKMKTGCSLPSRGRGWDGAVVKVGIESAGRG